MHVELLVGCMLNTRVEVSTLIRSNTYLFLFDVNQEMELCVHGESTKRRSNLSMH